MAFDASEEEIAMVAALLDESPLVDGVAYVDRAGTYQEFRAYYAGHPEVLDLVDPEDLPTSFRVTTTDPDGLGEEVADLPGVGQVDIGP